ncbi:nucleotidyltransferase domain-containing protein [bacterium]|nr:MAG: nucleotidyltransferase domain-containing protein [bacterium]
MEKHDGKIEERISDSLLHIEQNENVKILFAVESGSRAWGFESKDSDYDVRFVYIHPLKWYLQLETTKEVLEYPVQGDIDLSGWDVKKALWLFAKSNPTIFEWIKSPVVYIDDCGFRKKLLSMENQFFSPRAGMYHYLNMAKGNLQKHLLREKILWKKYFYVLRPLFACMWIEKYLTPPPMKFEKLANAVVSDCALKEKIFSLVKRKKSGREMQKIQRIDVFHEFFDKKIEHFENIVSKMPDKKIDIKILDELFFEILNDENCKSDKL